MSLLEKLLYFFVPDIEEQLDQAIYKMTYGGNEEDMERIERDWYFNRYKKRR